MARDFAKAFYNSTMWADARAHALKRDNYMCQTEGCYRPAVEVHHIVPLSPKNINDPEVTVNPNNLISLCFDCHKARHNRGTDSKLLTSYHFGPNGEIISGGALPREGT